MQEGHSVSVEEAVQVLAMIGDLSMGQPTDQSSRAAWLAERLALADGAANAACAHARLVTLLRWSGCTANAGGFTALLGDDVRGRDAMLAQTLPPGTRLSFTTVAPLAQIHCDVSGAIAQALGLPLDVETGLRRVWEHHDGGGMPARLRAPDIPRLVYYVNLASDLDILARAHGRQQAMQMIAARSDRKYPAGLVRVLEVHADAWLDAVEAPRCPVEVPALRLPVSLSIVADMIELKLPWLFGYSRRVAELAEGAARLVHLSESEQRCLGRAALLHGVGRAAVPNSIWQREDKLGAAEWEKLRLVPYWTARIGTLIPSLRAEAQLASHSYERADGSGYYRELNATTLTMPQHILAAAAAYAALRMPRPWRASHAESEAASMLTAEARAGRFHPQAVQAVVGAAEGARRVAPKPAVPHKALLSERETAVLRRLSMGESNKEVARELRISPSTVGTHVENIFRKLGCSTRAAATLTALTRGLI